MPRLYLHFCAVVFMCAILARGCEKNADCNGAGVCKAGICNCALGFKGNSCEKFNFKETWGCAHGGSCLKNISTWGGSVVMDDEGMFHMFSAILTKHCPLKDWLTNSNILHSVSKKASGPYIPHDIALGDRDQTFWDGLDQHNPEIKRAPDGTYLLFYMGTTGGQHVDCEHKKRTHPNGRVPPEAVHQRIGLAWSTSPYGPWKRSDKPILGPGEKGKWDSLFTTNPAAHIYQNGSVLLIYKARGGPSGANASEMYEGIAFAKSWKGPYLRSSQTLNKPLDLPGNCEDAGLWRDEETGVFRMLTHCGCTGQFMHSTNGFDWKRTTKNVPWCDITFSDNTHAIMSRRERPKIFHGHVGKLYLSTAVMPPTSLHDGRSFTMITELGGGSE